MPRACTVCTHPDRAAIDAVLLSPTGTNRTVSKRFGLTPSAVFRHRQHLPTEAIEQSAAAHAALEGERAKSLAELWLDLHGRARAILARAEAAKDDRTALLGIRELTRLLDMPLRHAAELRRTEPSAAPLQEHADFDALVRLVMAALREHPAARQALADALAAHARSA